MHIRLGLIKCLHLDRSHYVLTGRGVQVVEEFFKILDVRSKNSLDDVQFMCFMRVATDLSENQIRKVFEMFDVDKSATIEFDEFYLLICMLIAIKDQVEKQFLWCHSRTCFELLDEDGSKTVSIDEFEAFGFVFNISRQASKRIFAEFDVDNSQVNGLQQNIRLRIR